MRRLSLLLLAALLLLAQAGCAKDDPLPEAPGEIQADVRLTNRYFGLTMTLPTGWWLYSINPKAFNNQDTGDPANWDPVEGAAEDYYIEMLHLGTGEDSTALTHASFLLFAESFPFVETLEDFANLTAVFYAVEDQGYTAEFVDMRQIRHNGTDYFEVRFRSTHQEHPYVYENIYYVCKAGDLFITAYLDYWEDHEEGRDAVLALFDGLTLSKAAG